MKYAFTQHLVLNWVVIYKNLKKKKETTSW